MNDEINLRTVGVVVCTLIGIGVYILNQGQIGEFGVLRAIQTNTEVCGWLLLALIVKK